MIFWENNDDVTFLDISWLILSLFLPHRARIFLLNRLGLFLHQSECQKAGFRAQIGINMKFFWDKYQDVVTFLGICWLIFPLFLPHLAKIFLWNRLVLFLLQSECQKVEFGAQMVSKWRSFETNIMTAITFFCFAKNCLKFCSFVL